MRVQVVVHIDLMLLADLICLTFPKAHVAELISSAIRSLRIASYLVLVENLQANTDRQ